MKSVPAWRNEPRWRELRNWVRDHHDAEIVLAGLLDEYPRKVYATEFTCEGGRLVTCVIVDATNGQVVYPCERLEDQEEIAGLLEEWDPQGQPASELVVHDLWELPDDPVLRRGTEDVWADAACRAGWTVARIEAAARS